MFILKKIGELIKFLAATVVLFIGLLIISYSFMFVLDLYPKNCNYVSWPLHEKCLDMQASENGNGFNSGLNGDKPFTTYFIVKVPDYTFPNDKIFLETDFGTFEMKDNGNGIWTYNITRPGELKYRYNRNNLGFLTAEKFEYDSDKTFRSINFTYNAQQQNDKIDSWRYFSGRKLSEVTSEFSVTNISSRDFMKGISLGTYWKSGFNKTPDMTYKKIKEDNADWVIITTANSYASVEPLPAINKISESNLETLKDLINSAKKNGLKVMLKIKLCCNNPAPSERNSLWWNSWFNETEKTLLNYAEFGNLNNVDAILIDYTYGESIPGASHAPRNGISKWENILTKMRENYNEKIGFNNFINGDYRDILTPWPDGVKSLSPELDFYGVEVWTALGNRTDLSQLELNRNTNIAIEHILQSVKNRRKPVVITGAVYSSVDGCAESDIKISSTTPGLFPWEPMNGNLTFDSVEQAMVYEALLKAISDKEIIQGFFSYNYGFIETADSLDYSVRGKEAEQVLKNWYSVY